MSSNPLLSEKIIPLPLKDAVKDKFLSYAMSVIISRALPNVDDGFKPVHRRILYAMYAMRITSDKPYKKAARIVGEVIGKYHPHGDAATYETITKMIQTFATNIPFIDGHGNFGSIDGDSPAAMRYTEIRLSKIANAVLEDLAYATVDMVPNYEGSEIEPTVLPGLVPNLLINGSTGIAVGMATSIPPHNFSEVIQSILEYIDHPEITVEELVDRKILNGPDFPTGAFLVNKKAEIIEILRTGRGSYKIRSKYKIEEYDDRKKIIIEEIPFHLNKIRLIESIIELVKNKKILTISDLRDESNRLGIRIVISLKSNANVDVTLNKLFKLTRLQTTFSVNSLALHDKQPELMGIKQIFKYYVEHQIDVIVRKTKFLLKQDQKRLEILLGLNKALKQIDQVIELIKKSQTTSTAQTNLENFLKINDRQSKAILEMRLQKITALEQTKISEETKMLESRIVSFEILLADPKKQKNELKRKLNELLTKFGISRRTEILNEDRFDNIQEEDLITSKKVFVCVTKNNYVKRIDLSHFRNQKRGGVGIRGITLNNEDLVQQIIQTDVLDNLLFFTNLGKVYQLRAWKIPDLGRIAKGTPIQNLININSENEKIQTVIVREKNTKNANSTLFFATIKGLVKRTRLDNFDRINQNGKIAIKLRKNDNLAFVFQIDSPSEIILSKSDNKIVRFSSDEIPIYGRSSQGLIGTRMNDPKKNKLTGASFGPQDGFILSISSNGKGKITAINSYPKRHRGAKGVLGLKTKKNTAKDTLVASLSVSGQEDMLIARSTGKFIISSLKQTRILKTRSAAGVRLVNLEDGETISAVAVFNKD